MPIASSKLPEIFEKHEQQITDQWIEQQQSSGRKQTAAEREQSTRQSREFVRTLKAALKRDSGGDIFGEPWAGVRDFLVDLSSKRAKDGYSPKETATFVFALKQSLFAALKNDLGKDAALLVDEVWQATLLIDELALLTTDAFPERSQTP